MIDPVASADEAGLKYVSDADQGIRRLKKGKGFTYVDEIHGPLKCEKTLARIKALVIPPAWSDVWICRLTNGHLQVTGRDKRNRKQYRYHDKWTTQRNDTKFDKLGELAKSLPHLRRRITQDLKRTGLPQEKIVAAIIKLMLLTQTRVGNSEYAEENESYGLTTILNKHAKVTGQKVKLSFKGKSGVAHDIDFSDPVLSKIIRHCQDLPGEELFAYIDDKGHTVDITSTHVNNYLKEVTGKDFTAKDLRTWGGTCKAIQILVGSKREKNLSERQLAKRHLDVIKATAAHLRNTVSVCRKYYIHPSVFKADHDGHLHKFWLRCGKSGAHIKREERLVSLLLKAA